MDPAIRRQIELEMNARGFTASAQAMAAVNAQLQRIIASDRTLLTDNVRLQATITSLTAQHVAMTRAMTSGMQSASTAVQGLNLGFLKLEQGVKKAAEAFLGFSSFEGFIRASEKSLDLIENYNKSLLSASAGSSKYGIGISTLETELSGLSRQFSLTMQDTQKLFKQFESSFSSFSMKGFEGMVKNIEKIVGPSTEAIGGMLDNLSGVLKKMPQMQTAMERMNAGDKAALQLSAQRLLAAGQLSVQEYKNFQNYIKGGDQATAADRKRMREIQDQQKTFQEFARYSEKIGLMLANAVMPVVTQFSHLLTEHEGDIKGFFDKVGTGMQYVASHASELIKMGKTLLEVWVALKAVSLVGGVANTGFAMAKGAFNIARMTGIIGSGGLGVLNGPSMGGGGLSGMLGFGAGGAARLARGARFGVGGAVLGAASYGLNRASEYEQEQGNTRSSGALGLGGAAAGIGGYAMTGMAIGSIIPGIGTALGGIIGAGVGVVSNFHTIAESSKKLGFSFDGLIHSAAGLGRSIFGDSFVNTVKSVLGYQSEAAKQSSGPDPKEVDRKVAAFLSSDPSTSDDRNASEEKQQQIRIVKMTQEVSSGQFNASDYQQTLAKQDALRARLSALAPQIENQLKSKVENVGGISYTALQEGKDGVLGRSDLESKHNQTVSKIAELQEARANTKSDSEAADYQAQIDKLTEIEKAQRKAQEYLEQQAEEVQKSTGGYREISNELKFQEAKEAAIINLKEREVSISESLKALAQSNVQSYNIMIERAKMIGDVTDEDIRGSMQNAVNATINQKQQLEKVLTIQQSLAQGKALTAEQQKAASEYEKQYGTDLKSSADAATAINNIQNEIAQSSLTIVQLAKQGADAYQGQLGFLNSQTSLLQGAVALADSYATGVGASAKMRMQVVASLQNEINMLKQQASAQEGLYAIAQKALAAANASGDDTAKKNAAQTILTLDQQRNEIQGQILEKTRAQAEQQKSLADGWISALGAMNTGAGRFTKIMISQQQNLSAGLRDFGVLVSNTAGSNKGGFDNSSRFTGNMGQLTTQTGGNAETGGLTPYHVDTPGGNDASGLLGVMRGNVRTLVDQVGQNTQRVYDAGKAGAGQASQAQAGGAGQVPGMTQTNGISTTGTTNVAPLTNFNGPAGSSTGPTGTVGMSSSEIETMRVVNLIVQGTFSGLSASSASAAVPQPITVANAIASGAPATNGGSVAPTGSSSTAGTTGNVPGTNAQPSQAAGMPTGNVVTKAQQLDLDEAAEQKKLEDLKKKQAALQKLGSARQEADQLMRVHQSDLDAANATHEGYNVIQGGGGVIGKALNFTSDLLSNRDSNGRTQKDRDFAQVDKARRDSLAAYNAKQSQIADLQKQAGDANPADVDKQIADSQARLGSIGTQKKAVEQASIEDQQRRAYQQYVFQETQKYHQNKVAEETHAKADNRAAAYKDFDTTEAKYDAAVKHEKEIKALKLKISYHGGGKDNVDAKRLASLQAEEASLNQQYLKHVKSETPQQRQAELQKRRQELTKQLDQKTQGPSGLRGFVQQGVETGKKLWNQFLDVPKVMSQAEFLKSEKGREMLSAQPPLSAGQVNRSTQQPASGAPSGLSGGTQTQAQPSQGGSATATATNQPVSLNYAIPAVNVTVRFDNLNQLGDIIKTEISKEFTGQQQTLANAGDTDRRNRV